MFKVTKEHTFWWPVKVRLPDPDKAGAIKEETFNMRFRALAADRAKAIEADNANADIIDRSIASILEVALDWSDVVDDDRNPVPFTPEALTDALLYPFVRDGIVAAYAAAISGQAARQGN